MNLKLPADLGVQAIVRITAIVQEAERDAHGALTVAGSQYIRDTVALEFGKDMADSIMSGERVELDYKRDPKKDAS